jgi:hypothetical protein
LDRFHGPSFQLADRQIGSGKGAFGPEAAEGAERDSKGLADRAGVNELRQGRRCGKIKMLLLIPISRDAFGPKKPEAFAFHVSAPASAIAGVKHRRT